MRTAAFLLASLLTLGMHAGPKNPVIISKDGKNSFTMTESRSLSVTGNWDFTGYKGFSFTVRNNDERSAATVVYSIADSRTWTDGPVAKGRMVGYQYKGRNRIAGFVSLNPGETRKFEVQFPFEVDDDVDKALLYMRNTPFTRANGMLYCNLDLSDVTQFIFSLRNSGKADKGCEISDITVIPGKRRQTPAWAKRDSASFFPFVDRYGQNKYGEWPGKVHSDKDLLKEKARELKDLGDNPGPEDWDQYGGWKKGPRFESTGHFHTRKIDGKWWLVDPEGYLYYMQGALRVTPSSAVAPLDDREYFFEDLPKDEADPFYRFYFTKDELLNKYYDAWGIRKTYDYSSANIFRKYGEDYLKEYGELCHRRFRSWGLNMMSNSSDRSILFMDKTPYNERVDLGTPVKGCPQCPILFEGVWFPFPDPFDPLFPVCVRAHLEQGREKLEDPWCVGFYVDSELDWHVNYGKVAATAPSEMASKQVFVDKMMRKYVDVKALNKAWGTDFEDWNAVLLNEEALPASAEPDYSAFAEDICRQYFSTVRRVYKEIAPQTMYLGCRLNNFIDPPYVHRIAAEYSDVLSMNLYAHDLYDFRLKVDVDMPIVISEFHFGALDRGPFGVAQVYCNDQEDRAQNWENYAVSGLRHPNVVGTIWHQFSDQPLTGRFDGENFQVGLTDVCDTPYYEIVEKMRALSRRMYDIRFNDAGIR